MSRFEKFDFDSLNRLIDSREKLKTKIKADVLEKENYRGDYFEEQKIKSDIQKELGISPPNKDDINDSKNELKNELVTLTNNLSNLIKNPTSKDVSFINEIAALTKSINNEQSMFKNIIELLAVYMKNSSDSSDDKTKKIVEILGDSTKTIDELKESLQKTNDKLETLKESEVKLLRPEQLNRVGREQGTLDFNNQGKIGVGLSIEGSNSIKMDKLKDNIFELRQKVNGFSPFTMTDGVIGLLFHSDEEIRNYKSGYKEYPKEDLRIAKDIYDNVSNMGLLTKKNTKNKKYKNITAALETSGSGIKKKVLTENGEYGKVIVDMNMLNKAKLVIKDTEDNILDMIDLDNKENFKKLLSEKNVKLQNISSKDIYSFHKLLNYSKMSDITSNRSSLKSKIRNSPSQFLQNEELMDRLKVLLGSHVAGNNRNMHLKNEVMFIIDKLLNEGILNKEQHENIYKEFIKK